ncbi:HlyD family efflux transporter periplasmic adaptor subunit [Uliginosibacterium sp. H3]|uniref:HlyD family efflux transporter periplasmic adaptor subunit n=1 Tax=Uliginosibacterium silvisoli TaxID=3114758 RepID=A0ABU6K150_9RHOO|nr:HlyD family efflux transporter periplasmic adaptor subunit [Uliginosibacterium sp. H3]
MSDTPNNNANANDVIKADAAAAKGSNRRRGMVRLAIIFILLGGVAFAWWFLVMRNHESTDDAYVSSHIVLVTPQVGGTVTSVEVDDTQSVHAGDVLVRLDPVDAQLVLNQAETALAQSVRELRGVYANLNTLGESVRVREAELARQTDLLERRRSLAGTGAVAQEEVDQASEAVKTARAALQVAREQKEAASVQTENLKIEDHPAVLRAASKVEEAYVAVSRTTLRAPLDGVVARRNVQAGQRVAAGAPLLAVVPLNDVWVDANFKESQLREMRVGQPVKLRADMYGSKVDYDGRVAGVSAGTGGVFSLLPAQNATGNWIKVVQRVPVRIELNPEQVRAHPLRVGLSVAAEVDVRDVQGQAIAADKAAAPVPLASVDEAALKTAHERVAKIIHDNLGRKS